MDEAQIDRESTKFHLCWHFTHVC